MIVELYGLPASGKTTIARELSASLSCRSNRERPLHAKDVFWGFVCFPMLALTLVWRALHDNAMRDARYLLRNIAVPRIAELGRAWRTRYREYHVLDEGPLQALFSVSRSVTQQQVRALCAQTPADVLVVCMSDSPDHTARMDKRLRVLRPHLDDEKRAGWKRQLLSNHAIFVEVLRTDPRTELVTGEADAVRAVEAIATRAKVST